MICSMILENYRLTWPPLGMSQEACFPPDSCFALCRFTKCFLKTQGRPYNVAAGGSGPARISQGKLGSELNRKCHFSFLQMLDVCHVFTRLGGTMVLRRAKEGIRQSPGAPEASNSFQIFPVLHSILLDLGYQSKQLLLLIYSFPKF